jgi:HEAT repeat protein
VSIKGSPYARFKRSLETQRLPVVLAAAAELNHVGVDDALEILILMAQEEDPLFDRAAARWVGRLLTETPPMSLRDARFALTLVERLPACAETLRRIARRR